MQTPCPLIGYLSARSPMPGTGLRGPAARCSARVSAGAPPGTWPGRGSRRADRSGRSRRCHPGRPHRAACRPGHVRPAVLRRTGRTTAPGDRGIARTLALWVPKMMPLMRPAGLAIRPRPRRACAPEVHGRYTAGLYAGTASRFRATDFPLPIRAEITDSIDRSSGAPRDQGHCSRGLVRAAANPPSILV